jgi:hypothetical protein
METQASLRKALMTTLDVKQEDLEELMKTNNPMKLTNTLREAVQEVTKPKKKNKEKPKWAMSEKAAEESESKEVDDLLDFAKNLDFEEFISDIEVKEAVNVIQSRVKELQSEVDKEDKEEEMKLRQEQREQAIQDRIDRAAALGVNDEGEDGSKRARPSTSSSIHDTEWNSSTKVTEEEREKINAMKLAENIIKNDNVSSIPVFFLTVLEHWQGSFQIIANSSSRLSS